MAKQKAFVLTLSSNDIDSPYDVIGTVVASSLRKALPHLTKMIEGQLGGEEFKLERTGLKVGVVATCELEPGERDDEPPRFDVTVTNPVIVE